MAYCGQCDVKLDYMPFHCRRCGDYLCAKHRLPENHACPGLRRGNIYRNAFDKKRKSRENTHYHHTRGSSPTVPSQQREPTYFSPKQENSSDIKQREGEKKQRFLKRRYPLKVIAATAVILFFAIVVAAALLITPPRVQYVEVNKTSTLQSETLLSVEEPSAISYRQYLDNPAKYANQEVSLAGFLSYDVIALSEKSGVYTELITDDVGNRIALIGIQDTHKSLFPKGNSTTTLYNVSGKFRVLKDGLKIQVVSIEPGTRLTKTIQRKVVSEHNVTSTQNISLNQTENNWLAPLYQIRRTILGICSDESKRGTCTNTPPAYCNNLGVLIEDPANCGCPEGMRNYEDSCIAIVTCSDGTLAPECSRTKPDKCIDGRLVPFAESCGCPEDHRRKGNTCEKIQRCSDGTEYGDCTKTRPVYCDKGKLVDNAEKCGCPYRKEPLDNKCVELERAIERKVFELTNEEREHHGLRPLRWSDRLAVAARSHSQDMASRNYFSHDTPEGRTTLDRFGYGAENINMMPTGNVQGYGHVSHDSDELAKAIVDSWMNSPGHRANILHPDLSTLGVGVAYDGSLYYYATQDFGW